MNKEKETIICPCCKEEIKHNDSDIPEGMKYEIRCPSCKTYIMLRKINQKKGERVSCN